MNGFEVGTAPPAAAAVDQAARAAVAAHAAAELPPDAGTLPPVGPVALETQRPGWPSKAEIDDARPAAELIMVILQTATAGTRWHLGPVRQAAIAEPLAACIAKYVPNFATGPEFSLAFAVGVAYAEPLAETFLGTGKPAASQPPAEKPYLVSPPPPPPPVVSAPT